MRNKHIIRKIVLICILLNTIVPIRILDPDIDYMNTDTNYIVSSYFNAKANNEDNITINLISPKNNSIHNGDTTIHIEFFDENKSSIQPITELYKWDNAPNFESILRPLPMEDGIHHLYVEVEDEGGTWFNSHFVFYSDNVPPSITLNSPENGTHVISGEDIIHWQSSYPSGSLSSVISKDINNDLSPDVLVGGSVRRVYAFDGLTGTNEWQTIEFPSQINDMEIVDDSKFIIGLTGGEVYLLSNNLGSILASNSSETSSVLSIITDNTTQNIIVEHGNSLRVFNYSLSSIWETNLSLTDTLEFISLADVNFDSINDIVTINQSSFVRIYNQSNGNQLYNYTLPINIENIFTDNDWLYVSFSNGYVRRCNITTGVLDWGTEIEPGQIIWKIVLSDNDLICSSGSGKIFRLNTLGSLLYTKPISTSYIKEFTIFDFDKDAEKEIVSFDGTGVISNTHMKSGNNFWNNSLEKSFTDLVINDISNDTFMDMILVSNDGSIFAIDPRGYIPKLLPAWTNISFTFNDTITGNKTFWEKYSWDGNANTSSLSGIPPSSGIHTLDVWISDNASNVAHRQYQFFSVINLRLNSPTNNSFQQGNTPINITLSETPLQQIYTWDGGSPLGTPLPTPNSETNHTLEIFLKDQSQNVRTFTLIYTTDNTPLSSITLASPTNDSVVEGGEVPIIKFSESPHVELYSWNGNDNTSELIEIPSDSDTHVLTVFVADAALNWKTARYVFHTKIQIELTSHMNNSIINPNVFLNFSFGEIPDVCQYEIDSSGVLTIDTSTNNTLIQMPSTSMTHILMIRVNDSINGRWNQEAYVFRTIIILNLTSHENGSFAETGDPLNILFSDPPITKLFSWDGLRNSSRLPIVPAPDGLHYLDVYVGNIEGDFWHYHYEFNVDTDLIDILLISPINNTRINSWANISFSFSEDPVITLYTWDNGTPTTEYTNPPAIDGVHTLNVTVLDDASNVNSILFLWIIDDTLINISLTLTNNNSIVYSGEYLNISFNEDPLISWYSWDSNSYSPNPVPVPWGNRTRSLNVTVFDGLNWNTQIFNLTIIDVPPTITVDDPDRRYQSNTQIPVDINENYSESWHRWDNGSKINGLNILSPADDGSYILTIHVIDLGGSYSEIDIGILVDNTAISILTIDPKNNSHVKGGELVNITFSETPFSVSYKWNDEPRAENLSAIPLIKGETIKLNIKAYDEAGNLLEVNIFYRIPTEAEQQSPLIIAGGIGLFAVSVVTIIFRGRISGFLKKHIRLPKRAD